MKSSTHNKGFTLIELLVVIAIIALLASVVMTSLNSARIKARNTKRTSDVGQLVKALNLGISPSAELPNLGDTWSCISESCYSGWSIYTANSTLDAFLLQNIASKPADPSASGRSPDYGGYLYNYAWTGAVGYGGVVFPAGTVIHWLTEHPISDTVCAPGKIYAVVQSQYIACMVYIN